MSETTSETTSERPGLAVRAAGPDDGEFLVRVYASTRQAELAMTNWDAAQCDAFIRMQFTAQQHHYRTHYPEGVHQIILLDGQPVGRLYWANLAEKLHLLDITVLPEYRDRGVGTALLKRLLAEAAGAGKPATIYVESFNPSQRLFARLGFRCINVDGFQHLLEWRNDPAT